MNPFNTMSDQDQADLADYIHSRGDAEICPGPYVEFSLNVAAILDDPGLAAVNVCMPASFQENIGILITALKTAAACGQAQGRKLQGTGLAGQGYHSLTFGQFADPTHGGAKYSLSIHDTDDGPHYSGVIVLGADATDLVLLHEAIHWAENLLLRTETDIALEAQTAVNPNLSIAQSWSEGTHPMAQGRYDYASFRDWYREIYMNDPGERFVIDCFVWAGRTREQAEFVSHDTLAQYLYCLTEVGVSTPAGVRKLFKRRDLEQRAKSLLYGSVHPEDIRFVRHQVSRLGVRV